MQNIAIVLAGVAGILAVLANVPHRDLEWETRVVPLAQSYAGVQDTDTPLIGKVVVVTGATSGIGLSLTKMLSRLGATVVALGRSPRKLSDLQNEIPTVRTVLADLDGLESVAKAAQEIIDSFDHIDILVNNAGMHDGFKNLFGTFESKQGYDRVFAVNYLSHFLLTEKLAPKLMNSTKPTILQVTSSYHWVVDGSDLLPQNGDIGPVASQKGGSPGFLVFRSTRSYANSKLAQILHARALKRNHPLLSKARVVNACPAWVGTEIGGSKGGIETLGGYDVNGWGLASILSALFDKEKRESDYYTNTRVFDVARYVMAYQTHWMYKVGIRDFLGSIMAFTTLFFQRLAPEAKIGVSSPESHDKVLGDALYEWSLSAVKPFL